MDADKAAEKKQVRVTIFNQSYTIVTSGDPAETEDLARRVDELMYSIAKRAGNVDSTRAAVLASLHLADQLRTLERELAGLRERVGAKSREFSVLLDQVVGE
jgi:cell division protein ZapA (FtsZ GTPase activity inhibitor)